MIFGREITPRLIVLAVAGLLLLIGIAAFVHSCDTRRSKGAQSRLEHSQAQAASNSAADAIATVQASGEASAASEALTRSNEKEIRNAQGANDPVNPAARDAGLRALCKRQAYKNDPRCSQTR